MLDNIAAAGVDYTFVVQDSEAATGVALIVVDDAGQNSIVVASGANMRLVPADVDAAEAVISSADVLLLQLESPLETVTRAAELAHAHGVRVILNPAPARSLPAALLSIVDVLVPNEGETALLTGLPVGSDAEAEAAAAALRDIGVGTVILTLGQRGAILASEKGTQLLPAFEEGRGHGSWFIHIQVDPDAIFFGTLCQSSEVKKPDFMVLAKLGKDLAGCQLVQGYMQPYPIDPQ